MKKIMTPFSTLSGAFRARIVKTWAMTTEFSPAEASAVLNEIAIKQGYRRQAEPVPGSALAEWGKTGNTPLWAAQAALDLLLNDSWVPLSDEEWAGLAAIYITGHKNAEFETLVDSLPASVDKRIAAGWFAAAIEENLRYKLTKKTGG